MKKSILCSVAPVALVVFSLVAVAPYGAAAQETSATAAAPAAKKPNVIFVYTDDMGVGDVSCFAAKPLKVKTPNIDKIARQGLMLRQFYVSAPICSASRASVLTGMNSPETQLTSFLQSRAGNVAADQNDYLDPKLAYLPKSFQQAGYATAHVGKWHLGGGRDVHNAPSISNYGYDEFWSTWESPKPDPKLGSKVPSWNPNKPKGQLERSQTTGYMVDRTLDFMNRHKDKACFITLWPEDVHTPFVPSQAMMKKYGGGPKKDRSIENFYGVLEEYDKQIGRLTEGLDKLGLAENTILVFSGDNGPNPDYNGLRSDGMRGKKGTVYEGGIREPFIIRWPGHVPVGQVDSSTVMCSIDLLPTLTALAGVDVVAEGKGKFDGEDMSAAMLGKPVERKEPLKFEFGRRRPAKAKAPGRSPQLAIRDGDYKLLVNRDGSDVELYNLKTDRNETTNIADKETSRAATLKQKVIQWSKTLPHRTHPKP